MVPDQVLPCQGGWLQYVGVSNNQLFLCSGNASWTYPGITGQNALNWMFILAGAEHPGTIINEQFKKANIPYQKIACPAMAIIQANGAGGQGGGGNNSP